MSNHAAAIAHEKNTWNFQRCSIAHKAVEHLWNSNVVISAFTEEDQHTRDFTSMVLDVQKKLQLQAADVVRQGWKLDPQTQPIQGHRP